jgi:DNA-binding CsgD family transcriptional regulator/tetratricopeptide (TPR) repeat protein
MDGTTLTPHGQPTSIVGRDRERAQLDLAIGDGSDGLRFVLLTGPSGYGKTTLLADALTRAEERGMRLAVGVGRSAALTAPLTPWCEAVPEFAAIVNQTGASSRSLDIDSLGIELVRVLTEISEATPLVLAFDDVQALDESSLALLPFVFGISDDAAVSIMLVEQSDAAGTSNTFANLRSDLTTNHVVRAVELQPMSDDAVVELAQTILGAPNAVVPPEVVIRAEGNPWFAIELLNAFTDGDEEVPATIAAAALHRLGTLNEDTADLALAVAVSDDGISKQWLREFAGLDESGFAASLQRLLSSGLIRERDDHLSIAHPLMQQALVDELSAAMRRAIHAELAGAITTFGDQDGVVVRARGVHLGLAGKVDEAIVSFCEAAAIHERSGQVHEALSDYLRAISIEPRIAERLKLLRLGAFAALQAGSDRAPDLWTELARIAAATGEFATYSYANYQRYMSSGDASLDLLKRAIEVGVETDGWAARSAALLAMLEGDLPAAVAHGRTSLSLAREHGDEILEVLNLGKLGNALSMTGAFSEAIDCYQEAIDKAIHLRFHGWAVESWMNLSETLAESLQTQRALEECTRALAYVDDLGLRSYRSFVAAMRSLALTRCGDLHGALDSTAEAIRDNGFQPNTSFAVLVAETRANVLIESGDVVRARHAIEAALAATQEYGNPAYVFEADFDRAMLLAASGQMDEAISSVDGLQIEEPGSMARLALWSARTAVMYESSSMLAQAMKIRSRVPASDVPLAVLMLEECDALAHLDHQALTDVSGKWRDAGRMLDAARSSLLIGILQFNVNDESEAKRLLKIAHAELSAIGASVDADIAASILRRMGARSKATTRVSTVDELTERELQIVRLVASGMRNAEVAEQLRVANKTVAAHLSKIYGKLGINSRGQLTAWAQRRDAG